MKQWIVNADDFGLTKGVNHGIIDAHLQGIVTSTTLMVTMDEVEHAIALAKYCPNLGIGLHLNMTLGKPLTPCRSLIKPDGTFYKPKEKPDQQQFSEQEIYLEFVAQYRRFVACVGREPTHLDSHLYAHQVYEKAKRAATRLAEETHCPLRDVDVKGYPKVNFLSFFSAYNHTVESLKQCLLSSNLQEGQFELMVHPAYVDEALTSISSYALPRILELAVLMDSDVKEWFLRHDIERINYQHIKENTYGRN